MARNEITDASVNVGGATLSPIAISDSPAAAAAAVVAYNNNPITIELQQPIYAKCSSRLLNLFATLATPLSERVQLSISERTPLAAVEYQIQGFGYIRYYLLTDFDNDHQ